MRFLAHRGVWSDKSEQNTIKALVAAVEAGFGIEVDIRDRFSDLVISHDPPNSQSLTLEDLLIESNKMEILGKSHPCLALNIKSDGLVNSLSELLRKYHIIDYFCFDMSGPETVRYSKSNLKFFTRQSEIEERCLLYERAHGVWLDAFDVEWRTPRIIDEHLAQNKELAIVSPELHGRAYKEFWSMLSKYADDARVQLCTDYPWEAKAFFRR